MAIHTIIVRNMAGRDQRFQVHGWNNNQDIVVKARSEHKFQAADGSSGAVIAVYDGHVAEQAEITKNGFGGNDFIDMSNICGAGGNMIVQQVGDNKTRKGDPKFMQNLQNAWNKASQQEKNDLKNCVFLKDGKVVRIGAPKDFPKLEQFLRKFADGKTYIGVGAWNGSPGNASDNAQSSAAHGSKDILICYNDGDCTPNDDTHAPAPKQAQNPFALQARDHGRVNPGIITAAFVPTPEAPNGETKHEAEATPADDDIKAKTEALLAAAGGDPSKIDPAALQALAQQTGEVDANSAPVDPTQALFVNLAVQAQDPGPGIDLTNKSKKDCEYFFYDNYWNGNGTAGANFDHPLKSVKLKPGQSQHVPLPTTFKGRVQRGTQLPCTWVEFQIEASNDHRAHGDISLQQGCDGAATIASTDGTNVKNGFEHEIVSKAPEASIRKKPNGERAIDTTVGNWNGGPNKAAIDYLNKVVGQSKAYILGGTGVPDIASKNKRLAVVMF